MIDFGKRIYASPSKSYQEFIEELTEQEQLSRGVKINPGLKQPYMCESYVEMMYLYDKITRTTEEEVVLTEIYEQFFKEQEEETSAYWESFDTGVITYSGTPLIWDLAADKDWDLRIVWSAI